MNPVIERLQGSLLNNQSLGIDDPDPLNWTFPKKIHSLKPDFYRKIIPSHMVLSLEYSLLGQQIEANLSGKQLVEEEQLKEQLIAALLLAELLENVYQDKDQGYLNVPREVKRLRAEQQTYRAILTQIIGPLPKNLIKENSDEIVHVGESFSWKVRLKTINLNLYRLLFIRSKRALDLIAMLNLSADWYPFIVGEMDHFIDPFLPHLAWIFFVPRLSVNLFLLIKHTIPGPWMKEKEEALGWAVRFQGQMLRRWFELGNDGAWFGVGFINCFLLTGALAPFAPYLALTFFVYDVFLAVGRAYIELNRLYELRKQYQAMAVDAENDKQIEQHLTVINSQIEFEMLRLGSHVLATTGIFLSMCCSVPFFAVNPIIPVVGAICLVIICIINFILRSVVNHNRPKDIIKIPSGGAAELGFFSKKAKPPFPNDQADPEEDTELACSG